MYTFDVALCLKNGGFTSLHSTSEVPKQKGLGRADLDFGQKAENGIQTLLINSNIFFLLPLSPKKKKKERF